MAEINHCMLSDYVMSEKFRIGVILILVYREKNPSSRKVFWILHAADSFRIFSSRARFVQNDKQWQFSDAASLLYHVPILLGSE